MDEFCDSIFWDSNVTWDSGVLEFTSCFYGTVLVWFPCIFLWVFSLIEVAYIKTSQYRDVPWNFFNVSKFVLTGLLICLSVIDLALILVYESVSNVDIVSVIVKILTFILVGIILYFSQKRGLRSSIILFMFWLFLVLCGIPQLRASIQFSDFPSHFELDVYQQISYLFYYTFILIQLVLSCFADKEPKISFYDESQSDGLESNPCVDAGVISYLFFLWINKLIWKGYKKPLEADDVFDLCPEQKSKVVYPKFKGAQGKSSKNKLNDGTEKITIVLPLLKAFGGKFLISGILSILYHSLEILSSFVLGFLINFLTYDDDMWKGIFYSIIFFANAFLMCLLEAHDLFNCVKTGIEAKSALLSAIYRKSLKISNSFRKEHTTGEIVNLMAVDAQRFLELPLYLHSIWLTPTIIIVIIYLLYNILGVAAFAGIIVLILVTPFSGYVAARLKTLQNEQMIIKDHRIKIINEILNGMKVLKFYAWEMSFEKNVEKVRRDEIKVLKTAAIYNAIVFLNWTMTPFVVSLATFATYVLIDEKNTLNPEIVFVSIALFNILRNPLVLLAIAIQLVMQAWISVDRIKIFLNSEEIDSGFVTQHQSAQAIDIQRGFFSWETNIPLLENIDLAIKKGNLVAVVGPVGSGKSSLISAILGEMYKISGSVNVDGKLAYVPQQAWIQNCTLEKNVTFGKPLDRNYYNQVIEACALTEDLKILAGGDQTEIGERGINLSGGQKARVSLARAVYSDSDIYLLDDTLSALDSHVGKHVFEKVFSDNGMLKGKTRFLVTHSISCLPYVDEIIVMSNGKISEKGSYKQLLAQNGEFSKFLEEFVNTNENMKSETKVEIKGNPAETANIPPDDRQDQLIKEEEAFIGAVSYKIYLRYAKTAGILMTIGILGFNALYQLFAVLSNIWLTQWSEENETTQIDNKDFYLAVFGGLGVGQLLMMLLASLAVTYGTIESSRNLHNSLTKNILRLPMTFFDTNPLGRILNRFSRDIDVIDNILPQSLRAVLIMLFFVVAIFIIISVSTPIFIAFIIPVAIVYYFIQKLFLSASRQLKRLESIWRSPIFSFFSETLSGLSVIRATREQNRFTEELDIKIDDNQKYAFPYYTNIRWLGVYLQIVGAVIIFASSLFAVFSKDVISPAVAALALSYALQVAQSLRLLVRMTSEVETNIVAIERIEEYTTVPQEAEWEREVEIVDKTWPDKGVIEFKDFQFRYREGLDLALKGITFRVQSQEKIGIVGRTGAGKSSLTLALFRIVEPAGGKILIDGIDITDLGLHTLRSKLTIIPQDPVLFSGSLRMNLDPFDHYSDEAVWTALEHSHLKIFVRNLSDGLNHVITEGGDNLSVGQRQLVCLARALLRKTKILILDEATAAIDLETDELIQKTIREQFFDCTILTIAHRINTILDSDKVLVLDQGKVVEFDHPQKLLKDDKSLFYNLAQKAGLVNNDKSSQNTD